MRKREENSGLLYKLNADSVYMIFMSQMKKKRKRWKMERNKHHRAGWASCFIWRIEAQYHYSPVITQESSYGKETWAFPSSFSSILHRFHSNSLTLYIPYYSLLVLCFSCPCHLPRLSGLYPPLSLPLRTFSRQFSFIYKTPKDPKLHRGTVSACLGLE